MRVRTLLPVLLAAAVLPGTAHASPNEGFGDECSVLGATVAVGDRPTTAPVGALWVVPYTNVSRMVMQCAVWSGAFTGAPYRSFSATTTGVPVLHFATVTTLPATSQYIWCMTVTAYGPANAILDVHDRCYVQPVT